MAEMDKADDIIQQALMNNPKKFVRDFSQVVMNLENVLIPEEKIHHPPSIQDGLSEETDAYLRILGCEMIQTAGFLLQLPQVAMATGQVLYQRFFYIKSFVKHNYEVVAMASITLASKIEEAPRRIRDVANVFHHIKQIRNQKNISPLMLDLNYINLKNQVIKSERRLLKELGFCVHVKHPHKIIVTYLSMLDADHNQRLVQCAWQPPAFDFINHNTKIGACAKERLCNSEWVDQMLSSDKQRCLVASMAGLMKEKPRDGRNFMNDSFRSNVFVRFNPETIACSCIYLAARQLQIPLPSNPHWFLLFGVLEVNIREVCKSILRLYRCKKPNVEELEREINEAKKAQIESKLKAKAVVNGHVQDVAGSQDVTPELDKRTPQSDDDKIRSAANGKESNYSRHPTKGAAKRSRTRSRSGGRTKKSKVDVGDSRPRSFFGGSSHSSNDTPKQKSKHHQDTRWQHVKEDHSSWSNSRRNNSDHRNKDYQSKHVDHAKYYSSENKNKYDLYGNNPNRYQDKKHYEKEEYKRPRHDDSPRYLRSYNTSPAREPVRESHKSKHKSKSYKTEDVYEEKRHRSSKSGRDKKEKRSRNGHSHE